MWNRNLLGNIAVVFILLKMVTVAGISDSDDAEKGQSLFAVVYYALDYALLGISMIRILTHQWEPSAVRSLLFVGLLLVSLVASALINDKNVGASLTGSFRFLLPLIFLLAFLDPDIRFRMAYIRIMPPLIVALSIWAILLFPAARNRNEVFWPVYFSGLHTQCYVLLAGLMLTAARYRNLRFPWWSKAYIAFALVGIIWGYNVRTTIVGVLVFLAPMLYERIRQYAGRGRMSATVAVGACYLVLAVLLFMPDLDSINQYSSGRISMYIYKFNTIYERSILHNLFGTGAGSDKVVIDIWWWEEKGSHNDYLTFMIENGLIFLLLMAGLFHSIWQRLSSRVSKRIFLVYIIPSLISNGFLMRPFPAMILMLSVLISEQFYFRKQQHVQAALQ